MIPYQKIRALVRQLQPNTIIVDHNGGVPWEVDVEYFEEPLGVTVPSGNVTAGAQGQTIAKDKNWFWRSTQAAAGYLSASSIANEIQDHRIQLQPTSSSIVRPIYKDCSKIQWSPLSARSRSTGHRMRHALPCRNSFPRSRRL